MQIECVYNLAEGEIPKFEGCASFAVIDEHQECISNAFRKIKVTVDIDDEWGFCKIVAVNGHAVDH